MRATIYRDTEYEISWGLNDPISPDLVEQIFDAGREQEINWHTSPFADAANILLTEYSVEEIEEKIYDEDPDIIDLVSIAIQSPLDETTENIKIVARLYLPVVLIIVYNLANVNAFP